MLEKIMDYIIKTLTVIGIGLMLLIFPGMGIIGRFVSEETIDILFPVVAISFFVTGVLLMILVSKFGIKLPPTKAEKRELQFKDFDELQQFLEKTLLEDGYVKQDVFFLKRKPFTNLKCVAIVYEPQLSNERLKEANSLIIERLEKERKQGCLNQVVDLIMIVCVDQITPTFERLVNSNLQQQINLHRLFVGVCLEDKSIYIARQKDGFAITQYKKLRKAFLKIMMLH